MQASLLVEQLHHVLKHNKLDEPGILVEFQMKHAPGAATRPESSWFCLGSLQKMRPVLLHVLVHLIPHGQADEEPGKILCLETHGEGQDNRIARLSTSHQVLHKLYMERADHDIDPDISVSVWKTMHPQHSSKYGNHFFVACAADTTDVLGPSFQALVAEKQKSQPPVLWVAFQSMIAVYCSQFSVNFVCPWPIPWLIDQFSQLNSQPTRTQDSGPILQTITCAKEPLLPFGLSLRLKSTNRAAKAAGDRGGAGDDVAGSKRLPAGSTQKKDLLWASAFGHGAKKKNKHARGGGEAASAAHARVPAAAAAESSGLVDAESSGDVQLVEPLGAEVAMRRQADVELAVVTRAMSGPDVEEEEEEQQRPIDGRPLPRPASSEPPEAPAPAPAAARVKRLIGLCGFDVAPQRGQGSKCFFCSAPIAKGTLRFDYQFSESGKMARYIHPGCVAQIPAKGRENSLNFLRMHLQSDVAGQQVRDAEAILRSMSESA